MNRYHRFFLITVPLLLMYHSIFASEVIELEGNIEENNIKILAALNKFAEGSVKFSKKTKGFKYHYTNPWYSRYSFDIYLGEFAKRDNVSIIRIEAPKYGMEKSFRNYFKEELQKKDAMGVGSATTTTPEDKIEKLEKKSHIISQGLNLISPALSVIYNSHKSPVYTSSDALMRSSFYLLSDLLIGGLAYYFAMNNNDKKSMMDNLLNKEGPSGNVFETKYGGVVIAALVIPRLYRMAGAVEDTTTHNRLLELSYTFKY
ncbi:hypothetical protein [Leptospira interrogans]|uniref:Uncharacterized protein n=3 Tax=Leptospira interrogans TaxID=173 RepID=Q72M28_LEPIC|nr:hypothetical protein [Leptospira interrogans]AAS71905.1 conserved hypothetical protein [Leptospira interrogans serovar Copenhageni str. Fiocruz L1-130]KPA24695.1 Uncharacterized protein AMR48_3255 [Leptospira interrogans]KPA31247.1 Uncharacterized protein AMR50_4174 [Leptospira interrogans]MBO7988245.1 hypothetical protein [Leptospira interrogans serovar Copenhageni]MBO7991862.1 hypothetical protein [Leptospira interrogans serovar Copenhageni]